MLGAMDDPDRAALSASPADEGEVTLDGLPFSEVLDGLVELARSRFVSIPNVVTGISELDECVGPIEPGRALVVASADRIDGTTLALQIALRAALARRPVTVASGRCRPAVVGHRLLVLASGVDGLDLLHGRLPESAWAQLGRAVQRLASLDLRITDAITMSRLESIAGGGSDDGQRVPLVIVDGASELLCQPQRSRHLRGVIEGSATAWVFTVRSRCHRGAHLDGPATFDGGATDFADSVVALVRRGDVVVAEIENKHGWRSEVELYERRYGLGYFGRADRADAHVLDPGGERFTAFGAEVDGRERNSSERGVIVGIRL
jgi:hypothetical protein